MAEEVKTETAGPLKNPGLVAAIDKAADQAMTSEDSLFPEGNTSAPVITDDKKESINPEESASKEPSKGEEPATPKVAKDDEAHLPQELRTPDGEWSSEQTKRFKGFQAAFTRKMQSVEEETRRVYEGKFQEVLARLPNQQLQQPNQPVQPSGDSLAEFFPNVPKEQLDPLDKAMNAKIERRTAALQRENAELKSYMNQSQANQAIQQQYNEAVTEFPELHTRRDDLVAWALANPAEAKGRSIKDMYRSMTYTEQYSRGKEAALKELKKKESESLETDSTPNTVSTVKPKTLHEAANAAWQSVLAKRSKERQ